MTIAIFGADSDLGKRVLPALVRQGVAPAEIHAIGTAKSQTRGLLRRRSRFTPADLGDPVGLAKTLKRTATAIIVAPVGGARLPLLSIIDACERANVGRVVLTSALRADEPGFTSAAEHAKAEEVLRTSGLDYSIARCGDETDGFCEAFIGARPIGVLPSFEDPRIGLGPVAPATRDDYATAIAVIAVEPGHERATYNLAGDVDVSYPDLATLMTKVNGTPIRHLRLEAAHLRASLLEAEMPTLDVRRRVRYIAEASSGILRHPGVDDLPRLIARMPTTVEEALAATVA